MNKAELRVLFLSIIASLTMLVVERIVGIGWDYHPDSLTYATTSATTVDALSYGPFWSYFNNGYYVVVWLLGESVFAVTVMNMMLFGVANMLMYRAHVAHAHMSTRCDRLAIWLLLLNPYRLHLSTTMLKDSLLILLAVLSAPSALRFLKMLVFMAFFRIAAVLYGLLHLRGKYLGLACVVGIAVIFIFPRFVFDLILSSNEKELIFRDFDAVPTFQSLGLLGALLRATTWPLFAISGTFLFLSPSAMYAPVAMGAWLTLLYFLLVLKSIRVPVGLYFALFSFGILVSGFTSYIRYVYPLLTIWPLAMLYESSRVNSATVEAKAAPPLAWTKRVVRRIQRAQAIQER